MKKIFRHIVIVALLFLSTVVATGCLRQNYLMFEDGDFDGIEFSDYDMLQNAELEMDDMDRNWVRAVLTLNAFYRFWWFKKY